MSAAPAHAPAFGRGPSHDGTLHVHYLTATADLTGIWRITPGGWVTRFAATRPSSGAQRRSSPP
ncbi:hypothetical protein [Wenjunlia tyrosinilytica]|uniref:hypothetical protein n=1 Tax=Wenjunlia tyrosinilytica TaxID=1544741 RepID=UPI00166B5E42|nr:hypothetical protein [Wenjunlia tyrosinilytica]